MVVVGASGYAGEELVRLLLQHPQAELVEVTSRQHAGKSLGEIFPRFAHLPRARELHFHATEERGDAEVAFLAVPHGAAAELARPLLDRGLRVIDLSADFRLRDPAVYREYYGAEHPAPDLLERAVYGLPEIYRERLRGAALVACPGCYPTSILLPVLPLLRAGLVRPDSLVADSLSGVTGAGRKAEIPYLFAECNESLRPYGVPRHRHLSEIEQELSRDRMAPVTIQFTPHLVPVSRGLLSTIYFTPNEPITTEKIAELYAANYGDEPFIRLAEGDALPDTKNVVGSNFLDLGWRVDPRTGRVILFSAIDNVVKGTSGQAIQCFNLMRGGAETDGLI